MTGFSSLITVRFRDSRCRSSGAPGTNSVLSLTKLAWPHKIRISTRINNLAFILEPSQRAGDRREVPQQMPPMDDSKKTAQKPRPGGNGGEFEGLGMDELLDIYDKKMASFNEGDIIRGRVIKVSPSEVIVDIGYKSEGLLPINEVTSYDGTVRVKAGDEIDVYLERLEDYTGHVILSREKAERMLVWDRIEAAFKAD